MTCFIIIFVYQNHTSMKEFIVDLYPKGGGFKTATRVFAANVSGALLTAKRMNPNHRTGGVKPVS